MKNHIYKLLFPASALIFFNGCGKVEKNVHDYYPYVKTVSATVQTDGSVVLKGEIADEGASSIEYAGFCMDTVNNPDMLSNQAVSQGVSDGEFTAVYSGLDPYKTYYFRSWATNESGYSYGNTIRLDSIQATPVVPPCQLPANSIDPGYAGGSGPVSQVDPPAQSIFDWQITVHANYTYYFLFGELPVTGIYTTTNNTDPEPGEVNVTFLWTWGSFGLQPGSKVYVNQLGPDHWTIAVCQAPWTYQSVTFYMDAFFECPK